MQRKIESDLRARILERECEDVLRRVKDATGFAGIGHFLGLAHSTASGSVTVSRKVAKSARHR